VPLPLSLLVLHLLTLDPGDLPLPCLQRFPVLVSKDHINVSPARIIAYCIVAHMKNGSPISPANYKVVSDMSAVAAHPTLQVNLPSVFTVVGGGARANCGGGVGSMLFWIASYLQTGLAVGG